MPLLFQVECPAEESDCDSQSSICPCSKEGKFDFCAYALMFAYSAQQQLVSLLGEVDAEARVRKLNTAVKQLDALAEHVSAAEQAPPTELGSRSLLFAPFQAEPNPEPDPCNDGFEPTCEQARGFGLCLMPAVKTACNYTCTTPFNTSGHHLHREKIAHQPPDYTKQLSGPALLDARSKICDACKKTPEAKCCHSHPHRARALDEEDDGDGDCTMCQRGVGSRCGEAVAATIGGAASLFRRYLHQATQQQVQPTCTALCFRQRLSQRPLL